MGLRLWLYNTVIVDTFYNAPAQLAAAMVGSRRPGGHDRRHLGQRRRRRRISYGTKAASFIGDIGFWIAGAMVWCLIGLLCVYAMFLIALSNIALAVLLGARTAVHRATVLRCYQAIFCGLDRATGQLRV